MSYENDIRNGYIAVIQPEDHNQRFTLEGLRKDTEQFSKPVLYKRMVELPPEVSQRSFYEVEVETGKVVWREQTSNEPVGVRAQGSEAIVYGHASGVEGSAEEFLDRIFKDKVNCYSHLGYVSAGFKELGKYDWGGMIFERLRDTVLRTNWFQIPEWTTPGHTFLGYTDKDFGSPKEGYPGSWWHMFLTTNVFVMITGLKKWSTYPPQLGDADQNRGELIGTSGGREYPVEERDCDTVYVEPGDVLFNPPYEWHRVLNGKGTTFGMAFRVVDQAFMDQLDWENTFSKLPENGRLDLDDPPGLEEIKEAYETFRNPTGSLKSRVEQIGHRLTSVKFASYDHRRIAMALNKLELESMLLWAICLRQNKGRSA